MEGENQKFLFYCVYKEGYGEPFSDTLEAKDMAEAFHIFDNQYGLENVEEIEIKPVSRWKK